jgi:hypothetical protein
MDIVKREAQLPGWFEDSNRRESGGTLGVFADPSYPCATRRERVLNALLYRVCPGLGLVALLAAVPMWIFVDPFMSLQLLMIGVMGLFLCAPLASWPEGSIYTNRVSRRLEIALDQPRRLLARRLDLSRQEAVHGVAIGEREGEIVVARLHYDQREAGRHSDATATSRKGWDGFDVSASASKNFRLDQWEAAYRYQEELVEVIRTEVETERDRIFRENYAREREQDLTTPEGERRLELEQTVALLREQLKH